MKYDVYSVSGERQHIGRLGFAATYPDNTSIAVALHAAGMISHRGGLSIESGDDETIICVFNADDDSPLFELVARE